MAPVHTRRWPLVHHTALPAMLSSQESQKRSSKPTVESEAEKGDSLWRNGLSEIRSYAIKRHGTVERTQAADNETQDPSGGGSRGARPGGGAVHEELMQLDTKLRTS
ncbi:unnamed protein product [Gadus morhua 'NCC']